jgi:phosphotransferase system enzyme I (PtsP)
MAERVTDLRDIELRVVAHLVGEPEPGVPTPSVPSVLVAGDLAPSDTAGLDPELVVGLVTERGGPTSHTAIIARQLGIPCVVGTAGALQIAAGTPLLVDGVAGTVELGPDEAGALERVESDRETRAALATWTGPGATADGTSVKILANVADGESAAASAGAPVEGVGLFRTEFQFLVSATMPGRESQLRLYRRVLDSAGDKPVVFRTLDIGGDKALPYLTNDAEEAENPSMGWRALRLSLDRSTLMKAQARALIQAAAGRTLRVMFPMISEPWEYEQARTLFEAQVQWAEQGNRPVPSRIEFGAMLEVPSLAEQLDLLLPRLDFLSIGTNDLTQFLFAADRGDPRLAERYDWLSPSILRFLKRVLDAARVANKPVRICGEMSGRPLECLALIGLGAENFSITPAAVGPIKAMVRSLDAAAIRARMDQWLAKPPNDLRKALLDWARRHKVAVR